MLLMTTYEVCRVLRIEPAALAQHLRAQHVPRPERRAGLAFLWTPQEVEAARAALAVPGRRRLRPTAVRA